MSISAAHAASFYGEVAKEKLIWGIRDAQGFPAPLSESGRRSMPFWSSRSRAELIIKNVSAYRAFEPICISWSEFSERWIQGLTQDNILIGINWSGAQATDYDVEPIECKKNIEAYLKIKEI